MQVQWLGGCWLLDVQLTDFLIKFRELRPSLGARGGGGEGISSTKGVKKIITNTIFGEGLFAKPDRWFIIKIHSVNGEKVA